MKASQPPPISNRLRAWRRHEDQRLLQREREMDACEALSRYVHADEMVQRALQTAQPVLDAHGGRITVESREGVGTTFRIRLPLRPPGAPAR